MAYPDDIDSFDIRDTDDFIPKGDYNSQNDSIVAIETELGTNPKGGAIDVKIRLNDIDTELADKLNLSGGSMVGDINMSGNDITDVVNITGSNSEINTKISLTTNSNSTNAQAGIDFDLSLWGISAFFYCSRQTNDIRIGTNDNKNVKFVQSGSVFMEYQFATSSVRINDPLFLNGADPLELGNAGEGVILRTPDNTKSYKITVDNSGNIISTLV